MPKGKNLFKKPVKFGIAPGEHVIHIIGQSNNPKEVDIKNDLNREHEYNTVTQAEAYSSPSDLSYGEGIVNLAEQLEDYYADTNDPEFKDYLSGWKDYLCAESRSKQQKALMTLLDKNQKIQGKYKTSEDTKVRDFLYSENDSNILEDENKEIKDTEFTPEVKIGNFIEYLNNNYLSQTKGDLSVERNVDKKNVTEPSFSGASGFFSVWRDKSKEALFPHTPSPNDIKQGIGIEDCYMMSALTQIAAKEPEKIKDMMKDNGNGTVTVRFFENGDDGKRVPVYVDVLKTESRIMGVGANSYASSALWVQMAEKAFAKYKDLQNEKNGIKAEGLSGISRGNTAYFMEAISEHGEYTFAVDNFGFSGDQREDYSNPNKNYYNIEEQLLHSVFKNKCGLGSEVITVGSGATDEKEKEVKSHGIRTGHAYTVLGAFEADVDGEKKMFVRLRDPYATFSAGYDNEGNLVDTSSIIGGTYNAGTDNMGTFNMEMTDFMNHFNQFSGISTETLDQYNSMLTFVSKNMGYATKTKLFETLENPKVFSSFKDDLFEFAVTYQLAPKDSPLKNQISGFFGNYFSESVEQNEKNRQYSELKDAVVSFKEEKMKEKLKKEKEKSDNYDYILEFISVEELAEEDDFDFEPSEPQAKKNLLEDVEEKPLSFREQMAAFYKDLKSKESTWHNSTQYYNLEKAVNEASKCEDKDLEEKANEVLRCALEYNKQKDKTGFDEKSRKKLELVEEIADFAGEKASYQAVDDYKNGPKPLEKEVSTRERISLKDAEKEEGKREISKTPKVTKDNKELIDEFEIF